MVTTGTTDSLPLEFMDLPETVLDEPNPVLASSFVCVSQGSPKKYSYRVVEFCVNLDIVIILGTMDSWDMRPLPEKDSATASGMRPTTDLQPMMQVEPNRM